MNPGFLINIATDALSAAWSVVTDLFGVSSPASKDPNVNKLAAMFSDFVNTELWSEYRTAFAWNYEIHPRADYFRENVLKAFGDIGFSLNHIVDVIIPDSVNTGRRYSHGQLGPIITGLNQARAAINANAVTLAQTIGKLTRLTTYVNKDVAPLVGAWDKWGYKGANWAYYYSTRPAKLSKVLAPSMTVDVVQDLGERNRRPTVDHLIRIIAANAHDVTRAIDAGTVAVLNSGKY